MSALKGMRVLDLTQHLSGPYCTMLLGDMGADVIKVEKLDDGDDQRKLGPFINGESSPFMMINRNKKSFRLNLKTDEGKDLLYKLAKNVDVLVENFRPGIVKSLKIDYETIRQINPAIIYCSISGYGQTGPESHKGGFDIMSQGMAGTLAMNSEEGKRPVKIPLSIHDLSAGLTALYSILGAYIYRLNSGTGQYIDVALVDSGLGLTVQEASGFFGAGIIPSVSGTRNRLAAPYQAYRCKDGFVIIGAGNQRLWERLCRDVVNRPEWIGDPRFGSVSERVAHMDALEVLLEDVLAGQERQYWVDKLEAAGVPGGPINSYEQALSDPHILAREMVREIEHPVAGRVKALGFPAKMSVTPGEIRSPSPVFGQHTDEILREVLGLGDDDIAALKAGNVV
jgi:crotonobetainyl-CoA:carnitine CoA-transferase CaiB-like acyl-CoA transferase